MSETTSWAEQLLLSVAQTSPANGSGEDEVCQAIGLHRQQRLQPSIERTLGTLTDPTTTAPGRGRGRVKLHVLVDATVKQSVAKFVQMLTEDKKVSLIALCNLNCRTENPLNKVVRTLTARFVKYFLPIQAYEHMCVYVWYVCFS